MKFSKTGYKLRFVQKENCRDGTAHLFTLIYKFHSPITRYWYVLRAEYHEQDVFAIKFYVQQHSKSDFKYSKITNKGDLPNILVSCAKVVPLILANYPTASFGLIGARTAYPDSDKLEGPGETQRFRVYRYFAFAKFGSETFEHFIYPGFSGYLLVNRLSGNVDKREQAIVNMFKNNYRIVPGVF